MANTVFNNETDAIMARDYPAGVAVDVLLALLNAVRGDGDAITPNRLARRAAHIGVRRPDWYNRERVKKQRATELAEKAAGTWVSAYRRSSVPRVRIEIGMQHPVPAGTALKRCGGDGMPSVARVEMADDIKRWACCETDLETALEWGWTNGRERNLEVINALRRRLMLPVFEIRY